MFRLHIDIPMGENEADATKLANEVIDGIRDLFIRFQHEETDQTRYRLSKDEDRRIRNYLIKDENGHISDAKSNLM